MAKRLRIKAKRELLDLHEIACNKRPLRAYIANVKEILDDLNGPQYDDAIIKVINHYDEPDEIYIISFRDETDKEMEKRLIRSKNVEDENLEN